MDSVRAEHFLSDQIPSQYRALIPTTLKTAYASAKIIAKNEPVLQVESARDNHGRLITWCTDFAFKKLIETGQWPVDYRWRSFSRPTGRYMEIRLSHSVVTISQVSDPNKQPRNVVFRENGRMNNEPFFKEFSELQGFEDEGAITGMPHFLLTHGHQDLHFAHLGVPHAIHHRDYIYRTPNLMLTPHQVPKDVAPVEETDIDAAMTLKEEIEKWRRDNGE